MGPEAAETLAVKVTLDPALACADDTVSAVVVVTRKVPVTDSAAVIEIEQVPPPEQAPLHPAKVDPAAGVAVNVTTVPLAKFALQVPGQLMPAGALLIEPEPEPACVTESAKVTTLKVAVTDCAEFMVTLQLPVPEQAPLHPAKVAPAAGVAVNVTTVPPAKFALQVPGQLMPAGVLATVPLPVPAKTMLRGKVVQFGNLKLAIRVFHLNEPLVLMYSFVYQNVQSSAGSTCMAL